MLASFPTFPALRLRKTQLWLAALLPMLFVSDILYGAMSLFGIEFAITPGIILRGMVLITAIYKLIKHKQLVGAGLFYWIMLLFFFILPATIIGFVHGQSVFFDIISVSKVLYLPLVTGLFVVLIRRYYISENNVLHFIEYTAYLLGFCLLLSQATGFEKQTYGDFAFGSTGIFYAQNDMTLAFGLAMMAGGYLLVIGHYSLTRLFLLSMAAFACVNIGTRASLAVIIALVFTTTACTVWGKSPRFHRRYFELLLKCTMVLLLLICMLAVLIYGLSAQQKYSYQQDKLRQVAEGEFPRLLLVLAGKQHIEERSELFNVFGEGADAFQRGVAKHFPTAQERRVVEVDWLDIYGNFGIIFAMALHFFVLIPLIVSSYRFLIRRESLAGLLAAAIFMYLGHAIFAGHALTSPIPSTLAAAYLGLYFTRVTVKSTYGRIDVNSHRH